MTNLVLFYSDRMQGFFGLGAHIEEMIKYLEKQPDIHITLILTETDRFRECTFIQEDRVDRLYIPCPENGLSHSSEDTVVARTLALRTLQIAYPYLAGKENLVCWFNSIAELNIVKQIKNFLFCKILYVHHGWAWKDNIKVENDVFAREWKKGNIAFCPAAFASTQSQLGMVENADCIVTVTAQAQKYFEDTFGVPSDKLITIYNGITPPEKESFNKADIRKEFCIADEEKIILFSGRVVVNKGVFFLVEAFKQLLQKLPGCRLVLVGTGTFGEVLKAAMPVWAKVTLTECISRELIKKWYAVADLGILPSLMEQCSYTAIEMRFWRIPLIVSAVDGLDEMFEHEEDCLKIPVHHDQNGERVLDPSEICSLLYRLLTDHALCRKLTAAGYQKAIEGFTLEKMGKNYVQILQKITGYSETTKVKNVIM